MVGLQYKLPHCLLETRFHYSPIPHPANLCSNHYRNNCPEIVTDFTKICRFLESNKKCWHKRLQTIGRPCSLDCPHPSFTLLVVFWNFAERKFSRAKSKMTFFENPFLIPPTFMRGCPTVQVGTRFTAFVSSMLPGENFFVRRIKAARMVSWTIIAKQKRRKKSFLTFSVIRIIII